MSNEIPTPPAGQQGGPPAYCPSCGRPASGGSFCASCGSPLFVPTPGTYGKAYGQPVPGSRPERPAWVFPVLAMGVLVVLIAGVAAVFVLGLRADILPSAPVGGSVGPTPSQSPPGSAPSIPPQARRPAAAPTAASFADLYKRAQSGVVRISATTCDGGSNGTGFLVSPTLVATAAHVVDGAAALGLEVGENARGGYTSGVVVGMDRASDLAIIKTERPLSGHLFRFAEQSPAVGQEVAAIGFPEGGPMTFTRGTVSGLDRTIAIDGVDRSGLIQTDTAVNPGSSGGPMLATTGSVYGVVDAKLNGAEGIAYAVSPEIAGSRLAGWKSNTASVVSAACDAPVAPEQARDQAPERPSTQDPASDSVVSFFTRYFEAINAAEYDRVWSMMAPGLRGESSDRLARGLSTTLDTGVDVRSVTSKPDGTVLAHVMFTSIQAADKGPGGDTCDNWDLDYLLVPVGDSWQIKAATGHRNGRTHTSC